MENIIDVEFREIIDLEDKTTETLTAEANELYIQANSFASTAVILAGEVGKRLTIIKERVGHGNWEEWCDEHLTFSRSKAKNMMKLAEKMGDSESMFSNRQTFVDIGISKVWALLSAPEEVAEEVISDGSAADMSAREFQAELKRVKEENEALKNAGSEKQKAVEELREEVSRLQNEIHHKDAAMNEVPDMSDFEEEKKALEAEKAYLQQKLDQAKADLKDYKKKVKEDQDKIRAAAKTEAEEAAQAEIGKAKAESEKQIEAAIAEAVKDTEGQNEILRKEVDRLQKMADPLVMEFKAKVDIWQRSFTDCLGVIDQAEPEKAVKWKAAMEKVLSVMSGQL